MISQQEILSLAQRYNTPSFIPQDPVSFPHRYTREKDIEISAFIAQWLAYGRREMFLKVLDTLGKEMGDSPYIYIEKQQYLHHHNDTSNLYRFYTHEDYYMLCEALYNIYITQGKGKKTMQEILKEKIGEKTTNYKLVLETLISLFPNIKGVPQNLTSACKRLCMFLRWMVRKDGIVDFGLWDILSVEQLVIPVDTHVFQQSKRLGLCNRNSASFAAAMEITENLKKLIPHDPVLADFALFGMGVEKK